MQNKKDNSLKYSLIGASLLAGAGALGYYFYNKSSGSAQKYGNVKNLSKATTIKVLKQLKKELFTSFSTMSMMAQQIRAQTRGRASEAEVKEFVVMHPQINEEFKASENRAYKKHNVTQKEFENAVENLFKNDEEVQKHRSEIKSNFDKAAAGSQLDIKTEIPQSLTSQNTLQIIEEIMKASCRKIQEVFQQLSEEGGQVNMNDPQTLKALNSMKIDDIKAGILEKHGLENYDDPGTKILQYATTKYQQENPDGFSEKMMELEMKHRRSMELIQQNPGDQGIIDKTFSEAAKSMGGAGAGGMFGMKIGNRTQKPTVEKIVRNEDEGEKKTEGDEEKKAEDKKEGEQDKQEQATTEDKNNEESVEIIKKSEGEQDQQQSQQQQPEEQQQQKEEVQEKAEEQQQEQQKEQETNQEQQQVQQGNEELEKEQEQEQENPSELTNVQQLQKQAEQTQEQNEEMQNNNEQQQEQDQQQQ